MTWWKATKDTVDLGSPHVPKEESIKAFREIEHELKRELVHMRHDHDKHERGYFEAVSHLKDHDLAGFTEADFKQVRVAVSAYGIILFGKLRIPALPDSGPAYIHFRAFSEGPEQEARFHSIHTEEREEQDGRKTFRAIFTKDHVLDWFDG